MVEASSLLTQMGADCKQSSASECANMLYMACNTNDQLLAAS